jgi:hypothetical protein
MNYSYNLQTSFCTPNTIPSPQAAQPQLSHALPHRFRPIAIRLPRLPLRLLHLVPHDLIELLSSMQKTGYALPSG